MGEVGHLQVALLPGLPLPATRLRLCARLHVCIPGGVGDSADRPERIGKHPD